MDKLAIVRTILTFLSTVAEIIFRKRDKPEN